FISISSTVGPGNSATRGISRAGCLTSNFLNIKRHGTSSCIPLKVLNLRNISTSMKMSDSGTPKEIIIPIPSGHIAGKVWNEGGIPFVGLHGWMDNAGTWDKLAPLLPKNVSLISIDLPGHGLSSHRPSGTSHHFSNLLLVIERVVQHFGLSEVNLLAHSMSSGASILYAGTFPEKVKKVIMIDLIKPISVDATDQPLKTAQGIGDLLALESKIGRLPPRYEFNDMVDKMVKSYGDSLSEEAAKILLKRGSTKHADGLYSFNYDPQLKARNIFGMTFEQQKAFANRIQCELLLIKCSNGPLYESMEMYNEMLSIYEKKAKKYIYKIVEGSHHVHLNNAEIVAPILCEFMQNNDSLVS
ncbi:serine hydrolase-like, partial [Homarus americanus]